ncbi:MAG: hypothetical protein HeimC2_13120 [Candidatus Heimdallarchaeota archaeon LC_2]|nr:MAG: hypothetical protein HeimC2_13120 [Candidatus Heimdallarchaeota archaeon LC_2]
MQYCPACGEENPADSQFCMNCGSALIKSQTLSSTRQVNVNQNRGGYPPNTDYRSQYRGSRGEENVHPLAYLCACCVPIAGFVIWLVVKDENPDSANTILIISIISLVLSFILGVA